MAARATLVAKPIVRAKICILKFTSKNDYDHFLVFAIQKLKNFWKVDRLFAREQRFLYMGYLEIIHFFE